MSDPRTVVDALAELVAALDARLVAERDADNAASDAAGAGISPGSIAVRCANEHEAEAVKRMLAALDAGRQALARTKTRGK